jgi:colicin import membrane protein
MNPVTRTRTRLVSGAIVLGLMIPSTGAISASAVTFENLASVPTVLQAASRTMYTNAAAKVRQSATTSSRSLGTLKKGTKVTVIKTKNGWSQISNPKKGWIRSDLLTSKKTKTTSSSAKKLSFSQEQAARSAKSYLRFTSFSRKGLIGQLEYEGFSSSDAKAGIDSLKVNWRNQAVKSARSYLSFTSFSKQGLIDQLVFEGFSRADAEYAARKVGY